MEGSTQSQGESSSSEEVPEVDYIQRIMRSLTESSTSQAVPSQSTEQSQGDSGMGSSSYSFNDSYGRMPDISPGLNPWASFAPPPELRGLVADSSEPSWRTGSPGHLSVIQQEILADFPWLNPSSSASPSEVSFPCLMSSVASKAESDARTSVSSLEPSTPADQVAWAQSMLELQAFENSTPLEELLPFRDTSTAQRTEVQSPVRCSNPAHVPAQSISWTPATSGTSLNSESPSSELSDRDGEPKEPSTRKGCESGTEVAGTSSLSGKRKRPAEPENDDESSPSDDPDAKKPTARVVNRKLPRKKGGVKRVREPRYAIKTRTDTEVMDDGYKWRKYGQKAVKNSPHPRNYYRCTTPNCPVRKRVERCFDDPSLVVTTYEGTHTHHSPSFLRGPPGYPGGLQALLNTLSHHYSLAGNAPLPPFLMHPGAFPLSSSDHLLSPLWLAQLQSLPGSANGFQDNLNLLRAHEQLLRVQQQQEAALASSRENESGSFQYPGQGPSFSNVISLSDLSYDNRMNRLDWHSANSSAAEQLAGSHINPLEAYSSLLRHGTPAAGEYSSVALPDHSAGQPKGAAGDSGLLEEMFRTTNPSSSRA